MAREVLHRYVDPFAQVWLEAARRVGLRVVRTPDAYAATDGRGTLAIGDDATLDADDSLGQMIFHELCHSLVEGEASFAQPDWGLDNIEPIATSPDLWREQACLRIQWVLAGRHGLRGVLAPTTDHRAFWDGLSGDVLEDRADRSVQAAIVGLRRAAQPPWAPALDAALAATAAIATAAAPFAAAPSLWHLAAPPPAPHPTGLRRAPPAPAPPRAAPARGAGTRAADRAAARPTRRWTRRGPPASATSPRSTARTAARAAAPRTTPSRSRAAIRRSPRSPATSSTAARTSSSAARATGAPRSRAAPAEPRYRCAIYDDRPRTCRDFTLGSDHCLTARRRVGLSL